ncbi:DUF6891 domain-containing protein [Gimesia algae]|uniref:DUF6891 domain-containing protein n=1 Tax=Gimesia algae TaxID=2527971 RepID=A0A517VMQ7_9PLAN|nr:hypothetical protein [Gimesia algae]QDT94308.1 hypothetical protein Pan161_60040 [Gimesia algae]
MKLGNLLLIACLLQSGCDSAQNQTAVTPPPVEKKQLLKVPILKQKVSQMGLDAEALTEMDWLVRSGFYDKTDLMRVFCEEMDAPGDLDETQVAAAIDARLAAHRAEQKNWPAVTDCDRLDQAFAGMKKRGLITLENAGNTQTDGYDIFQVYLAEHPHPETVIGYCFYHNQDLERAVDGLPLYLAFGPVDPKDEKTKGAEIGNIIREELEQGGLEVEWQGTFNDQLRVPGMVWQKRSLN